MKTQIKVFILSLLILIIVSGSINAGAIPLTDDPKYNIQQREAQVILFNDALNQLGAASPQQVIELWVKGDQRRNGVYKYAVSCRKLKQELIKRWGKPEDSYWVIGTSSPWLDKYEVVSLKKINDVHYTAQIKYNWATSAGPAKPTFETISIIKEDGKWCAGDASGNGNY